MPSVAAVAAVVIIVAIIVMAPNRTLLYVSNEARVYMPAHVYSLNRPIR